MSRALVVRTASNTYRVPCSHCGNQTEVPHRQFPTQHRKFKVTCECGHVSRVLIERRCETRKPVQINGYLFALGTKEQLDDIAILELSISGLGFTCELSNLQVGDRLTVGFFLDDAAAAWIEQDIEVRRVQESGLVGAEFVNPGQYSIDLDFYLVSIDTSG